LSFFDYVFGHYRELLEYTRDHLLMVGVSTSLATLIGVPLGVLASRRPGVERMAIGFANIMQTIPSLALFGFLIPLPLLGGIGIRTGIVALSLYALLPILRNTYAGIRSVDPAVREAGRGLGMTDRQLLIYVELPLASGVILAGRRSTRTFRAGNFLLALAK